jgi:hypothetical protein
MTVPNPIIPLWFDAVMWLTYALAVGLAIVSIVIVARARYIETIERIIWIVAIVFVPVLGPIAWFVFQAFRRGSDLRSQSAGNRQ